MQETIKPIAAHRPKIRVENREKAEILNLLRIDWPMAKQVLDKLAAFMHATSGQSAEEEARTVLYRALDVYRSSVYHEKMEKHPDPVRISLFVDSVITETCSVLQKDVATPQDNVPPVNIVDKTQGLRFALYEILTSDRMKTVLKESNHEETILAGRMAASD